MPMPTSFLRLPAWQSWVWNADTVTQSDLGGAMPLPSVPRRIRYCASLTSGEGAASGSGEDCQYNCPLFDDDACVTDEALKRESD